MSAPSEGIQAPEGVERADDEFVSGENPPELEPLRPDHTLDGRRIEVKGSRLLVRILEEGEKRTPGGIIVPKNVAQDRMNDLEDLEEVEVLAVGQGRYNQDLGKFLGSNFASGDHGWMRRSAPHLHAEVPDRKNVLLIQEDLIQAVLVEPHLEEQVRQEEAEIGGSSASSTRS